MAMASRMNLEIISRDWHSMLFSFPIILFLNSRFIESLFFFEDLLFL